MSVAFEVFDEIRQLRQRIPGLSGSVVATMDGLLIAHDVFDIEPEGLAALAAANLGLGQRTASAVRQGDVHETVVRNVAGCVAVYAAGPRALLALVAMAEANLDRLSIEARVTATRVAAIVDVLDVIDFNDLHPEATAHAEITLGTGGYPTLDLPLDLPLGPPTPIPATAPPQNGSLPRRRP